MSDENRPYPATREEWIEEILSGVGFLFFLAVLAALYCVL